MTSSKEKELVHKILALFVANKLSYQESCKVLDEAKKQLKVARKAG